MSAPPSGLRERVMVVPCHGMAVQFWFVFCALTRCRPEIHARKEDNSAHTVVECLV